MTLQCFALLHISKIKKLLRVIRWKDGRITKMIKRWGYLHPTRKSYAFRTGKRSLEKLTNTLKIWLPRMSRGTKGKLFSQKIWTGRSPARNLQDKKDGTDDGAEENSGFGMDTPERPRLGN